MIFFHLKGRCIYLVHEWELGQISSSSIKSNNGIWLVNKTITGWIKMECKMKIIVKLHCLTWHRTINECVRTQWLSSGYLFIFYRRKEIYDSRLDKMWYVYVRAVITVESYYWHFWSNNRSLDFLHVWDSENWPPGSNDIKWWTLPVWNINFIVG